MDGTSSRRIVGLDLGVATAHTAQVLDEQLQVVCKRRVVPTVAGFDALEDAALAGAGPGTRLEVVIEPTGAAWLPVAVWFTRRGHTVFRVSTQKAHDLRRFLSRHAKSNSIDAHTLARLPLIDPGGLHPVHLPDTTAKAALDRRVRAAARLTDEIGQHKRRLIELARQAMPTIATALSGELSRTDLAVLERYGDPRRLATLRPPPVPQRRGVQGLPRADPQGVGDRRDRPQGPADVQSRQPSAPHPAATFGRDRKAPRPPARRDLPRPDGQQGRGPHQGALCRRGPPRRAGLDRDAPRQSLRAARHRRHTHRNRAAAKRIIAERFTVTDQIRRQRRSKKKGGRAPHQVLEGRASGQRSKRDNTRRPSRNPASPANPRPSRPATG
jgi:hypothetical protein